MPSPLNLSGTAGSPFILEATITAVDSNNEPISWGDFDGWEIIEYDGDTALTDNLPTIDSSTPGQLVISWDPDDTAALAAGPYTWALQANVDSQGPYSFVAGSLNMDAPTKPGTASFTDTTVQVFVGRVTASVAVTIPGASQSGGGVISFNGRDGVVLPTTGDYSAAQVGADASGAAAAAQTAAATDATTKANAAQAAAISTASSDATTKANNAQAASIAASDAAGSAAAALTTAEAYAVTKANAAQAAAIAASDASGAAAAAQTAAIAAAATDATTKVGTETTRAEAAEALALLKTGGTMSGAIAMGASKVTGLAAATANGDAVRFEQLPLLGLIAYHQYAPSSVDSHNGTADLSIIDATNLAVTFVVPASGKVLIRLTGVCKPVATDAVWWAIYNSVGPTKMGPTGLAQVGPTGGPAMSATTTHLVTGLTPGASITAEWAGATTTTSSNVIRSLDNAGTTGAAPSGQGAPATMEVYAA